MTSIRDALSDATKDLRPTNSDARFDAEMLLSHLLKKNRAYLFTYPENTLTSEQWQCFQELIQQRAQGVPIAYLTGQREFWSLPLKVNKHTLIPRHETERIVELALEYLPKEATIDLLDLGTGSGAIALALASERPNWRITACDLSPEALKLAQENANQLHLLNVRFYHSDWFNDLPLKTYHAILTNPPYIAAGDPHLSIGDARFEPLSALVSGQNGLADLQCIITTSYEYLAPGGLLLVEHGYDQKSSIEAILNKLDYKDVTCWQDIGGNDRVSGGWRSV
jgi:release factor glutamine methyltransferase